MHAPFGLIEPDRNIWWPTVCAKSGTGVDNFMPLGLSEFTTVIQLPFPNSSSRI